MCNIVYVTLCAGSRRASGGSLDSGMVSIIIILLLLLTYYDVILIHESNSSKLQIISQQLHLRCRQLSRKIF